MTNINLVIRILCATCFICVIAQSNCYAKYVRTTKEVVVKCSPNEEVAEERKLSFPGDKDTYLSFATKRFEVDGKDVIAEKGEVKFDGYIGVSVRCIHPEGFIIGAKSMFVSSNVSSPMECERGQGISVTLDEPNDTDHDKYRYVAELRIDKKVKRRTKTRRLRPQIPGTLMPSVLGDPFFGHVSFVKH